MGKVISATLPPSKSAISEIRSRDQDDSEIGRYTDKSGVKTCTLREEANGKVSLEEPHMRERTPDIFRRRQPAPYPNQSSGARYCNRENFDFSRVVFCCRETAYSNGVSLSNAETRSKHRRTEVPFMNRLKGVIQFSCTERIGAQTWQPTSRVHVCAFT